MGRGGEQACVTVPVCAWSRKAPRENACVCAHTHRLYLITDLFFFKICSTYGHQGWNSFCSPDFLFISFRDELNTYAISLLVIHSHATFNPKTKVIFVLKSLPSQKIRNSSRQNIRPEKTGLGWEAHPAARSGLGTGSSHSELLEVGKASQRSHDPSGLS